MRPPDIAADYDERGTRAARSVLVELAQVLGAHRDAIVVIGGAVPSLLLGGHGHIGTLDIDLDLDPEKLADHGYAEIVEKLLAAGYERGLDELKPFQLRRTVDLRDGGAPVAVLVDLLMPKGVRSRAHRPPLIEGLRVQEADGANIALRENRMLTLEGRMPDGRPNTVEMRVATIPALLVMKGYALVGRDKKKDAYDIYFSVRNYPDGLDKLADACRPLLDDPEARQALRHIAAKFDSASSFGPATVRFFLEGTALPDGMTPEQVQQDAFRQVDALLQRLGIAP